MFNKRSFVLGVGVGIIIGAMLLQLFRLGEESQNQLDEIGQQIEQGELPTATIAPTETTVTQQSPTQEPAPTASADVKDETSQAIQELVPFVVRIEPGTKLSETADILLASGAIEDTAAFINVMKSSGFVVRAGYFLFENGLVEPEEAAAIVSGTPITAEESKQFNGGIE
ncbi:hypothetical protein ACX1C1_20965 [Paenibacillus sp. strain BS8-2]